MREPRSVHLTCSTSGLLFRYDDVARILREPVDEA